MLPGRELDALIQVKVFGWTIMPSVSGDIRDAHFSEPNSGLLWREMTSVPKYSTQANEAELLLNSFDQYRVVKVNHQKYICTVRDLTQDITVEAVGLSMPHAVCLAVLKFAEKLG